MNKPFFTNSYLPARSIFNDPSPEKMAVLSQTKEQVAKSLEEQAQKKVNAVENKLKQMSEGTPRRVRERLHSEIVNGIEEADSDGDKSLSKKEVEDFNKAMLSRMDEILNTYTNGNNGGAKAESSKAKTPLERAAEKTKEDDKSKDEKVMEAKSMKPQLDEMAQKAREIKEKAETQSASDLKSIPKDANDINLNKLPAEVSKFGSLNQAFQIQVQSALDVVEGVSKDIVGFEEQKKGFIDTVKLVFGGMDEKVKEINEKIEKAKATLKAKKAELEAKKKELSEYGKKLGEVANKEKAKIIAERDKKAQEISANKGKQGKEFEEKKKQYEAIDNQEKALQQQKNIVDNNIKNLTDKQQQSEIQEVAAKTRSDAIKQTLTSLNAQEVAIKTLLDTGKTKDGKQLSEAAKAQLNNVLANINGRKSQAEKIDGMLTNGIVDGKKLAEGIGEQLSDEEKKKEKFDFVLERQLKPAKSSLNQTINYLNDVKLNYATTAEQVNEGYARKIEGIEQMDKQVDDLVLKSETNNDKALAVLDSAIAKVDAVGKFQGAGFFEKAGMVFAAGWSGAFGGLGEGLNAISSFIIDQGNHLTDWSNKSDSWAVKYVAGIGTHTVAFATGFTGGCLELAGGIMTMVGHPVDSLKGMGALIGRNPESGEWSLDMAGSAWKNLGKAIISYDEFEKGHIGTGLGKVGANVAGFFVGAGEVGTVGEASGWAGRAANAGKIARMAAKGARVAAEGSEELGMAAKVAGKSAAVKAVTLGTDAADAADAAAVAGKAGATSEVLATGAESSLAMGKVSSKVGGFLREQQAYIGAYSRSVFSSLTETLKEFPSLALETTKDAMSFAVRHPLEAAKYSAKGVGEVAIKMPLNIVGGALKTAYELAALPIKGPYSLIRYGRLSGGFGKLGRAQFASREAAGVIERNASRYNEAEARLQGIEKGMLKPGASDMEVSAARIKALQKLNSESPELVRSYLETQSALESMERVGKLLDEEAKGVIERIKKGGDSKLENGASLYDEADNAASSMKDLMKKKTDLVEQYKGKSYEELRSFEHDYYEGIADSAVSEAYESFIDAVRRGDQNAISEIKTRNLNSKMQTVFNQLEERESALSELSRIDAAIMKQRVSLEAKEIMAKPGLTPEQMATELEIKLGKYRLDLGNEFDIGLVRFRRKPPFKVKVNEFGRIEMVDSNGGLVETDLVRSLKNSKMKEDIATYRAEMEAKAKAKIDDDNVGGAKTETPETLAREEAESKLNAAKDAVNKTEKDLEIAKLEAENARKDLFSALNDTTMEPDEAIIRSAKADENVKVAETNAKAARAVLKTARKEFKKADAQKAPKAQVKGDSDAPESAKPVTQEQAKADLEAAKDKLNTAERDLDNAKKTAEADIDSYIKTGASDSKLFSKAVASDKLLQEATQKVEQAKLAYENAEKVLREVDADAPIRHGVTKEEAKQAIKDILKKKDLGENFQTLRDYADDIMSDISESKLGIEYTDKIAKFKKLSEKLKKIDITKMKANDLNEWIKNNSETIKLGFTLAKAVTGNATPLAWYTASKSLSSVVSTTKSLATSIGKATSESAIISGRAYLLTSMLSGYMRDQGFSEFKQGQTDVENLTFDQQIAYMEDVSAKMQLASEKLERFKASSTLITPPKKAPVAGHGGITGGAKTGGSSGHGAHGGESGSRGGDRTGGTGVGSGGHSGGGDSYVGPTTQQILDNKDKVPADGVKLTDRDPFDKSLQQQYDLSQVGGSIKPEEVPSWIKDKQTAIIAQAKAQTHDNTKVHYNCVEVEKGDEKVLVLTTADGTIVSYNKRQALQDK